MIYYNSNIINGWNFGDDNIIKVYKHGAVCYYKITSGDTPTPVQEPCFAVVDDITQYSDTEFDDVFDKATEKWYKLNNLNQYEEYGIYGEGRNITYYEGKLTVDDGYEYEWNGSSWVNLGEVSGSTITIKSPEYIEKNSSHTGYCELLETFTEDTKIIMKHRQTVAAGASIIGDYYNNDNDDWRVFFASRTLYYDFITQRKYTSKTMPMPSPEEWEIGNYYIKNTATGSYYINGTQQTFSTRPNQMYLYYLGGFGNVSDYGQVYYIKIYRGETLVRDFIPWTDMNGNYGLYDKVENELVHTIGNMTASTVINDVTIGSEVYPKYYSEKSEPLDNLTFNTLAEAQAYAETNCVYVGLKATINGDKYVFSGDSQSGYEWVYNPSRLPVGYTEVEYVQNTGTSYFDTNFKPNTNTRIVADMQQVTANDFPRLFGCYNWNATAGMNVDYEGGYLQISWFGKTSWTRITSIPNNFDRHIYDLNKNNLYVDETLVASTTYSSSYQSSDNLGIFFEMTGGRPGQAAYFTQEVFKGKMYSFQIYDNGTLVRDLVPCIKDNDNTVGAYDIVNDVFYTVPTGYTTDKLVAGDPV